MKRLLIGLVIIIAAALHCSINPVVSDDGGTTEITNAKIAGQIYKTHMGGEIIPVPDADVVLHSSISPAIYTVTDTHGNFTFDSVDTGRFWVEGYFGKNLGVVRTVDIYQGDSLLGITVLMKSMGGIRGLIDLDTISADPDSVYKTTTITIPEIERIIPVNSFGVFEDQSVPYFNNYSIIISNSVFPTVSGEFKAQVQEGRITEIDTANAPPIFTHGASTMQDSAFVGVEYRDTVHAVDPDNDSLVFILTRGPREIELQDSIITWTPSSEHGHNMPKVLMSVQVQDNRGGYALLNWTVFIIDKR